MRFVVDYLLLMEYDITSFSQVSAKIEVLS